MNDGQCQSDCRWPGLPAPYDAALREAVQYIEERYRPWGIVASGTVVRGAPDRTSDLDLCVIHSQPWRQRVQKFFSGVPAEIFVNPPASVRQYFQQEHAGGKPITAHMLATGWVVVARHEVVHTLRREAAQWLEKPVEYPPFRAIMGRYLAAALYEDARDVAEKDPATAGMLMHEAVMAMVRHWFLQRGHFIPRNKELIRRAAELDARVGAALAAFFTAPLESRWELLREIADCTIGADGFFEWETQPQEVRDAPER